MPERKGSSYAKELFDKTLTEGQTREEWDRFDHSYEEALNIISAQKKKPELMELDRYVHQELPQIINSRTPAYMQHAELAQLMRWKLTRGKSRPLQKLVESNTTLSVIDASTASFHALANGKMEEAFDAIMRLRGVGVATASAIFAMLYPNLYPFMADEVIESVTNDGREYTMTIYCNMRNALMRKGEELGWEPERVGRALWCCAVLNAHQAATRKQQRQAARIAAATEAATESKSSTIHEDSAIVSSSSLLGIRKAEEDNPVTEPDSTEVKRRKFDP